MMRIYCWKFVETKTAFLFFFSVTLSTRAAAGSPSDQLNSLSPSPGCSSGSERGCSGSERDSPPPGLLVYNFVNEGCPGELDSACRNAALEENL